MRRALDPDLLTAGGAAAALHVVVLVALSFLTPPVAPAPRAEQSRVMRVTLVDAPAPRPAAMPAPPPAVPAADVAPAHATPPVTPVTPVIVASDDAPAHATSPVTPVMPVIVASEDAPAHATPPVTPVMPVIVASEDAPALPLWGLFSLAARIAPRPQHERVVEQSPSEPPAHLATVEPRLEPPRPLPQTSSTASRASSPPPPLEPEQPPAATGTPDPRPDAAGPAAAAPAITPPEAIRNDPPRYPRVARQRGYEGTVDLRVLVGADGKTVTAEVGRSSGYDTLDRAAVRAARRWRFRPAVRDGKPTDMWIEIPVLFDLEDERRGSGA